MVSSILPKTEWKNSTLLLWYLKSNCFRSFFGRIEDTQKTFRNKLTFRIHWPVILGETNIIEICFCFSRNVPMQIGEIGDLTWLWFWAMQPVRVKNPSKLWRASQPLAIPLQRKDFCGQANSATSWQNKALATSKIRVAKLSS